MKLEELWRADVKKGLAQTYVNNFSDAVPDFLSKLHEVENLPLLRNCFEAHPVQKRSKRNLLDVAN